MLIGRLDGRQKMCKGRKSSLTSGYDVRYSVMSLFFIFELLLITWVGLMCITRGMDFNIEKLRSLVRK